MQQPQPATTGENLDIRIPGHEVGCQCSGCLRKRGAWVSPQEKRGEALLTKRHTFKLSEADKAWVMSQGGSDYLRRLILADKLANLDTITV